MKIVFFGTADFSIPTLELLSNSNHEICAVYTKPPKEQGRGMKLKNTPIHAKAIELNLPVFTPKTLKKEEEWGRLKSFNADIFVVIAYGLILPKEVIDIARFGCVNIHPSLLPRWRGASPLQRALMEGDKKTAVCIIVLGEGLDDGDIIKCKEVDITEETTLKTLHDDLSVYGAKLMLEALDEIEKNDKIIATPQSEDGLIYAEKIEKEECKIDFNNSVEKTFNLIRTLGETLGAFFEYKNERIKIIKAKYKKVLTKEEEKLENGHLILNKNELFIKCSDGLLEPLILQKEGRKELPINEFLRGFKI